MVSMKQCLKNILILELKNSSRLCQHLFTLVEIQGKPCNVERTFDISNSTEFLNIQMGTFLGNLFQSTQCSNHARRDIVFVFG